MNRSHHYSAGISISLGTYLHALAGPLLLSAMVIFFCVNAPAQTNTNLVTKFVPDAVLTPAQIQDVLNLVRKCGVTNAREIRTFHYLPAPGIGMSVKDEEHATKLTVDYCTVEVHCTAWGDKTKDRKAKRVGEFWVDPPYLETNHYAIFTHDTQSLRVELDPAIPLSVATTIFNGIEKGNVTFDASVDDFSQGRFKSEINVSNLDSLGFDLQQQKDSYNLMFSNHCFLTIKLINGKVVIMSVGHWVV